MKPVIKIFAIGLMILAFSCKKDSTSQDTETTQVLDSNGNLVCHEESTDYTWDAASEISITLKDDASTVGNAGASVSGNTVTVTQAGTYRVTGSLSNGQLRVDADGVVRLIFNGVTITNNSSSPMFIEHTDKTILVIAQNTQNVLTDGAAYSGVVDNEPNATLFCKDNLSIYGNGLLTVNGNYADAITSKDGLVIRDANIVVTASDDGVRGKDYLVVHNSSIQATVKGDGLKSDNESDTACGYMNLVDASVKVTSGKDAISAQTDITINGGTYDLSAGGGSSLAKNESISTKGIKALAGLRIINGTFAVTAADDALHTNASLRIDAGTFTLSSADDGIHAETAVIIADGAVSIDKSVEGIEAGLITVNNGTIIINASDDGFNASHGGGGESNDGSVLTITAGKIAINASGGDGLDSNGNIVISGGTIVVHGPQSQPEVGIDYNGTCNVTGGFLVVSGTNSSMTQAPSTTSSINSLKLMLSSASSANSLINIQDASGNELLSFKPLRSYYSIVFASEKLLTGSTYSIYTGGTHSGTEWHGLYSDGSYTAGTLNSTFTVSSSVTSVGTASSGGGGGTPGGGTRPF